jgi:UDP-N-acetylglucosamine acyltransferase
MGNQVHETAVLGPGVELGEDNVIGPYAVITGPCRIGDRNWIGAHTVIGSPPEIHGADQGLPWGGEPVSVGVEIGDDNVLREFMTVHAGDGRPTRLGSRCFLMNKTHIAHDSLLEDDVTTSPHVTLAGHVEIGAGATVGMASMVHQRRVVGPGAMIGMGAVITHDVPPYAKAFGSPARVRGVNEIGMSRRGIDAAVIAALAGRYAAADGTGPWTPPEALAGAWAWWVEHSTGG